MPERDDMGGAPSVRPSVCPSATCRYHVKTNADMITRFSPLGSPLTLGFKTKFRMIGQRTTLLAMVSNETVSNNGEFRPTSRYISEMIKYRYILTIGQ